MKKTNLSIIILTLLFYTSVFTQSNAEFLANKVCASLNESDLKKPKSQLLKIVQTKSNIVYQKYQDEMNSLLSEVKEKFPKKNESEIKVLATNLIRGKAMNSCLILQKISQKMILPELKTMPSSVTNVSNKLCGLLNRSNDKSAKALNAILNNNLYELVLENKKLIEEQYGDFASYDYKKDLNATLMKKCPLYLKLSLNERKQ